MRRRQDKARHHKQDMTNKTTQTRQHKTRLVQCRKGKARQENTRHDTQDKTREDKTQARQDKCREGKARQAQARHDKQDKTRQDEGQLGLRCIQLYAKLPVEHKISKIMIRLTKRAT